MTPRKKLHNDANARTRASRERMKAEGKRQIALWLSNEAVEKLDAQADATGLSRADIVESMIHKLKKQ